MFENKHKSFVFFYRVAKRKHEEMLKAWRNGENTKRNLRATYGGDEAQISVYVAMVSREAPPKRLLPNSRGGGGAERRSSFLIAFLVDDDLIRWDLSATKQPWDTRVQGLFHDDTHVDVPHLIRPSHVFRDELSLAYLRGQMVPRACLPTHSGSSRARWTPRGW